MEYTSSAHRTYMDTVREFWDYRELVFFLAWRDIMIRYRQTNVKYQIEPRKATEYHGKRQLSDTSSLHFSVSFRTTNQLVLRFPRAFLCAQILPQMKHG